jgi:ATP-binding cassette subfamily B protein
MKTQNNLSNFNFSWQYLKTEKRAFLLALVFIVINTSLQILTPEVIKYLINNVIAVANYTLLAQITAGMCIVFLLEAFIFKTQVQTVGFASQRIMQKIRQDVFAKLQKMPSSFFNQNQSGDLISRINNDTTVLDNFLGQYIFSFTSSFFVFLGFAIYLLYLSPILAFTSYFCVFLVVLVTLAVVPTVSKTNTESLASNGNLKGFLADNLNNYQVIQAYGIQSKLVLDFQDFNKDNQNKNYFGRIFINILNPVYNFAGNLGLFLCIFAIFQFGFKEVGTIIAFLFATGKFFGPLRELGSVFVALAEAVSALGRIREITNYETASIFKNQNIKIETTDIAISFENVTFGYNDNDKVLENISFQVPTNSKFAIIGPTGEGKSTIAKLMTGLLSQNSGQILVFNQELKNWSREDFYQNIGFILQDPFLFSGTVAQNIVYGNSKYKQICQNILEKTETEQTLIDLLIQDIKIHHLDSIISNLEVFLQTEVNNNSQNISQGQKQIVNFIRVLLREPKILILDEATANLDTVTEQYLQNALSRNKATQIVIAHRQNTIADSDWILQVGGKKVILNKQNI